jgi:sugar/nucleoside kinase (ribokinase family)
MLAVVGDLVEDVVVHTPEPLRMGSDAAATINRQRGGSAANVAVFAAAVGAPTRFVGCVGPDTAGDGVVAELEAKGVDVRVQRRGHTGTIVVVVDASGERTMLPDRAACALLERVDDDWLGGVEILHVPLYGFDSGSTPDAVRDMAARVRERGGRISVDVSSTRLVDVHGVAWVEDIITDLRPTWVSANADEVRALGLDHDVWLAAHPFATVLARAGAGATRVLRHGRPSLTVPVHPVNGARDTTGAGDAFAAGFLVATLAGTPTEAAVRRGHDLAARVICATGADLG